jgi:hypothetical protein
MLRRALVVVLALAGCAGGAPTTDARPSQQDAPRQGDSAGAPAPQQPTAGDTAAGDTVAGDTVAVRLGRTAELPGSGLRVSFQRLVGDSRCPINAMCVTAGDAVVSVRVERGEQAADATLHTNGQVGPSGIELAGHEVRLFGLTPAPVAGQPRPPDDSLEALFLIRSK